jgi:hypothetical protein
MEKMEIRFNEPNIEPVNERMTKLRNELHKDIKKIGTNLKMKNTQTYNGFKKQQWEMKH